MIQIVFSEAARFDRRAITAYTVERFGSQQARRFRLQLEATLEQLTENPLIGRAHEELDPPDRALRYFVLMKRFIIVYEPTANGIRVARILHGARNLVAELDRDVGAED